MKNNNDQKINLVLNDLLDNYKLKSKVTQTKIQNSWKEVMGVSISRYTRSIRLSKSKLYISIDSAPLKHELTYGKEKLKLKLNEYLGEDCIKEVIIR